MKRIYVGDWVEVSGAPGQHGFYIGEIKAITEDHRLIVETDRSCEIEDFEYCKVIARAGVIGIADNGKGLTHLTTRNDENI